MYTSILTIKSGLGQVLIEVLGSIDEKVTVVVTIQEK